MSEADRLMARPGEFAISARARTSVGCWQDWLSDGITAHDGMVRPDHPMIVRILSRTHSATSLQLLLRNPLGFVWKYAFGLKTPLIEDEPFRLDPLAFGTLTHEILDAALRSIELTFGLGRASSSFIARPWHRRPGRLEKHGNPQRRSLLCFCGALPCPGRPISPRRPCRTRSGQLTIS